MHHHFTTSFNYDPKLMGGQMNWKWVVKLEAKGHIHQQYITLFIIIGHMPPEGLAKANNLIAPFKPCFYSQGYALL